MKREKDVGQLRVAVNPVSLIHRARANFPAGVQGGNVTAEWRVAVHSEAPLPPPAPFVFTSCKQNTAHAQPPHFTKYPLRPEQQRSLGWMLAQESSDGVFVEEETCEAVLGPLKWRAEARVSRPVVARGGVVADQVGYGKTAITVGLVDSSPDATPGAGLSEKELSGRHAVRATLIIVPTQLMNQWPKEIKKFTGDAMTVVVIKTIADLNKTTVKEIEMADVVVTTNNILHSNLYFPRLAKLVGGNDFPTVAKGGRLFNKVYEDNLEKLRARVRMLKEHGAKASLEDIAAAQERLVDEAKLEADVGAGLGNTAKRLALGKGKKATYRAEKAAKKTAAAKEGMDVEEDSDDEEEEEERKKPAAAQKEDDADPWKLGSSAAQKDWREMKCPPLELFAWKRVVTDEFTYLDHRDREVVRSLTATYRWALSGTPPTAGFQDVKSIAALMGIHLGVDESQAQKSDSREFKALQKEMTASERFQARIELRTSAWHARRHTVAQGFMDRYVRQNLAEIDEIICHEEVITVKLTPAERAVYLELDHHLQAMEMKTKKSTKSKSSTNAGDREARLREIVGASGSAEEALLKRCSHYDLAGNADSAEKACEEVVKTREQQLELCEKDLLGAISEAQKMRDLIYHDDPAFEEVRFSGWEKALDKEGEEGCGDEEAKERLFQLIAQAGEGLEAVSKSAPKRKGEKLDEGKWELREHVHGLRRLQKELVGRLRSLRYFKAVRDMQGSHHKTQAAPAEEAEECPACSKQRDLASNWAVLSCCGHQGCHACLLKKADMQECPVANCAAPARPASVVRCSDLGCDQDHEAGGKFGSKLRRVVETVLAAPNDDRIIVFVQFADLAKVVAAALAEHKINAIEVKGSVHAKTKALDQMQEKGGPRVLLLNLADESASGANLTLCNHAIFVHPMLAESQEQYTACETQAIGRIRRYGQEKTVRIWRFIVEDTIDAKIFEERHKDWDEHMKK